jgi:rhodanese-related sulfurtransferase
MKNISVAEFKKGIHEDKNAVIVDVRTPEEEAEGMIENAININLMEPSFPAKVLDLDKSKNYYVFCRSGGRSGTACQFMEQNGLTAYNLTGGIQAWNASH